MNIATRKKTATKTSTLVLVPGSFNLVSSYTTLIDSLASRGYNIHPVDVRTVGKMPGNPPIMYDDAAFINGEATSLADERKGIVLLGHSYGGILVSDYLKGLNKKVREANGKRGSVARVAYMTALAPEIGGNAGEYT